MSKFLYIVFFILLHGNSAAQERLLFIGEQIDFRITCEKFIVNGIFYFVNPTSGTIHRSIYFPAYSPDTTLKLLDLENMLSGQEPEYSINPSGFVFALDMFPKDTTAIHVRYEQAVRPENGYVLKSTRTWNVPLHKARYTLHCDPGVVLKGCTYLPDSISDGIYYWTKCDFFPDKDLIFTIKIP